MGYTIGVGIECSLILKSEERHEMKFIKMHFPPTLFLPNGRLNSFYEDAPSSEKVKATGNFVPPVFPDGNKRDREIERESV